jgi:hypothetical protein
MISFMRAYCYTFFPALLLSIVVSWLYFPMGFVAILIVTLMANAAIAWAIMFICEKSGDLAATIYKGGSSLSKTQRYAGNLDQARYHKRSGRYDSALGCIDEYLELAGRTPEALYLKAQILWQGFGDSTGSKSCLKEILEAISAKDSYSRWSLDLMKQIDSGKK